MRDEKGRLLKGSVPWNKTNTNIECFYCKKKVHRKPSQIKRSKKQYCSKEHALLVKNGENKGILNPTWKGENASYSAHHHWVAYNFGKPTTCEFCGKENLRGKFINWANISGKYIRDKNDWLRLCKPCHVWFDDTINKGWHTRKERSTLY